MVLFLCDFELCPRGFKRYRSYYCYVLLIVGRRSKTSLHILDLILHFYPLSSYISDHCHHLHPAVCRVLSSSVHWSSCCFPYRYFIATSISAIPYHLYRRVVAASIMLSTPVGEEQREDEGASEGASNGETRLSDRGHGSQVNRPRPRSEVSVEQGKDVSTQGETNRHNEYDRRQQHKNWWVEQWSDHTKLHHQSTYPDKLFPPTLTHETKTMGSWQLTAKKLVSVGPTLDLPTHVLIGPVSSFISSQTPVSASLC